MQLIIPIICISLFHSCKEVSNICTNIRSCHFCQNQTLCFCCAKGFNFRTFCPNKSSDAAVSAASFYPMTSEINLTFPSHNHARPLSTSLQLRNRISFLDVNGTCIVLSWLSLVFHRSVLTIFQNHHSPLDPYDWTLDHWHGTQLYVVQI